MSTESASASVDVIGSELHFANEVVRVCLEKYESLPKTGKPKPDGEWTLLSAIVVAEGLCEDLSQFDLKGVKLEVVSLGTGSKCIGQHSMSPDGDVLNDSHAEVIARRGFLRYLYHEVETVFKTGSSRIFRGMRDGKCVVKDVVSFHFYTSQAPCGDASIFPNEDTLEDDYGDVLEQETSLKGDSDCIKPSRDSNFSNINIGGGIDLKGHGDEEMLKDVESDSSNIFSKSLTSIVFSGKRKLEVETSADASRKSIVKTVTRSSKQQRVSEWKVGSGHFEPATTTVDRGVSESVTRGGLASESATEGSRMSESATEGKRVSESVTECNCVSEPVTEGDFASDSTTGGGRVSMSAFESGCVSKSATEGGHVFESATRGSRVRARDVHRTGAKCLPVSEVQDPREPGLGYHVLGVLRTKPGRGDPTLSLSCSDKLARWNAVGCQGALLSVLAEPVTFRSLVVGGGRPFSAAALARSTVARVSAHCPRPPRLLRSHTPFPHGRRADRPGQPPCPSSVVWCRVETRSLEVAVKGRKQGVTKKVANTPAGRLKICKRELAEEFVAVAASAPRPLPFLVGSSSSRETDAKRLLDHLRSLPYHRLKDVATEYQEKWQRVKEQCFAIWPTKPQSLTEFSLNCERS